MPLCIWGQGANGNLGESFACGISKLSRFKFLTCKQISSKLNTISLKIVPKHGGIYRFWKAIKPQLVQCHIQQFSGGGGFSTSLARRKTVMQLESLRDAVSPHHWGPEPWKKFWLFLILNNSKHCSCGSVTTNGNKSLHHKLREI